MSHSVFGLPAPLLRGLIVDTSETLCLQISPVLKESGGSGLFGLFNVPPLDHLIRIGTSDDRRRVLTVVCSPSNHHTRVSSLAVNICCKVSLVRDCHPFVELFIEPQVIMTIPICLIFIPSNSLCWNLSINGVPAKLFGKGVPSKLSKLSSCQNFAVTKFLLRDMSQQIDNRLILRGR